MSRMHLVLGIPSVVAAAGLLTYAFSSSTKLAEVGRLAFACGLLATLFALRVPR